MISIIELVVIIYRLNTIDTLFTNGVEYSGIITKKVHFTRNPYVIVEYNYNAEQFRKRIYIGTFKIKHFQVDQEVILLLDETNPKKALIQSVFISE